MTAYKFGPYVLYKETAVLERDGVAIPLTKRRYEMIKLLVERANQIVGKDELIEAIWRGQKIDESNLAQLVYATRRLLGDTIREQTYIETVSGVGYRFRVPVEVIETNQSPAQRVETVISAAEKSRPTRRPWKYLFPVTISLVLLATFFWMADTRQPQANSSASISPLLSLPGIELHPNFSRDGRYIVFSWNEDAGNDHNIYYIDLNEGAHPRPRQVSNNPHVESHAVWGPDNREVAFLRIPEIAEERYHVIITSLETGREREVGRAWGGLDWSPDGSFLAVADNDRPGESTGIYLISRDGKIRRPLTNPKPEEKTFESAPRFSPDGRSLAFIRWSSDHQSDIFVIDVATGAMRQLTHEKRQIRTLGWSQTGQELFFVSKRDGSQQFWQISVNGGLPTIVASSPHDIGSSHISISPKSGEIAYTTTLEDIDIRLQDSPKSARSATRPCMIKSSKADFAPSFSPDNRLILFESGRSGATEIWLANADCSGQRPLTTLNKPQIGSSRWSPDGRQVVFNQSDEGKPDIWAINSDGSNLRQLTNDQGHDIHPAWSHDGRWIYFASDRSGAYEIWRISPEGVGPTQITVGGGRTPYASADGKYLFYTRNELLRMIDLQSNTDQEIPELSGIKVERYWHQVGEHIYYAPLKSNQHPALYRFNLRSRRIDKLFDIDGIPPLAVPGVSVSSDESRIAYSSTSYGYSDIMIFKGF
ncbi:MAG: winged helix-turn-helix domain-containing protein [Acidobacteriota bacterium]